ncbi:MAG: diguanylate cyclase, partial [Planctomycetes bacterium]|nr:diguanylate cyclase [Planctomycetota bacterium]
HSTPRIVTNADFTHELKRRAAESQQFGVPLSTIHIKRAGNDKADSGQVDQPILDLATHALAAALRETDLLTQFEHGEFAVLLPGSTESEANQMVKRMRMMLSSSLAPPASGKPQTSFHYGIAQLRKNETNQGLLARAGQNAMAGNPSQSVARV